MILAAVSMGTDFDYAPTNQQQVAVFIGVLLLHGVINTLNTAWLARLTDVCRGRKSANIDLCHLEYRCHLGPHDRSRGGCN